MLGAPGSDCEKNGQSKHESASVAPIVDEYLPASHGVQEVTAPSHVRYDPVGHAKQSPPISH